LSSPLLGYIPYAAKGDKFLFAFFNYPLLDYTSQYQLQSSTILTSKALLEATQQWSDEVYILQKLEENFDRDSQQRSSSTSKRDAWNLRHSVYWSAQVSTHTESIILANTAIPEV
jgi:hypothetical protein